MKRPTKRDADTESLEQAVAVPTLAPCVTIASIASNNRWPPLDKRSVKLSSPPPASQSTFANRVLLRQTLYNLSQNVYERSTTYTKVYFQTSAKHLHVKIFQQTQRSSAFASEHDLNININS